MGRPRLVAGNWKMHGSRKANRDLLEGLLGEMPELRGVACTVCVPFPYLGEVAERLKGTALAWGAQNVSEHAQGAYTGEVSAAMLAEFGCRHVIVGHSERRHLYGETDAQVAAKFAAVRAAGMTPILCVGETLQERDAGKTEDVVARQLGAVRFEAGVLAYEPVWAIGTGRNATPDDAAQVHELIRFTVGRRGVSVRVPILYGGSVSAGNVLALLARPELDGVLVGGASLDPDGWAELVGLGAG